MADTSRRERYRAELRAEALQIGLKRLESHGLHDLSIAGVAKELGLRAPSLYHYFASRDDLIGQLVLAAAEDQVQLMRREWVNGCELTPGEQLRTVANASRNWCLEHPALFRLVFAGGDALPEDRSADLAAVNVEGLAYIIAAVARFRPDDVGASDADQAGSTLQIAAIFADPPEVLVGASASALLRGYRVATFLVGLLTIEVGHQFASRGLDHGSLWNDELDRIIATLGGSAC